MTTASSKEEEMTYTKLLTQKNTSRKIVFIGKKGVATYPKAVLPVVSQEKLYEEYWKGMIV